MARQKPSGIGELRAIIEDAFERRATLTMSEIDGSTRPSVEQAIELLESGKQRVAELYARWEELERIRAGAEAS